MYVCMYMHTGIYGTDGNPSYVFQEQLAGSTIHRKVPYIQGPQYKPQNATVLIIGTPEMAPLIVVTPTYLHTYIPT